MAEGILALIGKKKPMMGGDEEDAEDLAPKEQALKDFFAAGGKEDWTGAAKAFQRAYDICKRKSLEGEEEATTDEDEEEEY